MPGPSTPTQIVIIGAGPYGLSAAAHLRRHGLPFRIFGTPMESWRSNMPAGMFLKSEGEASNLADPDGAYTLKAHCKRYGLHHQDYGAPVPLETFHTYGRSFQRLLVPELENNQVIRLDRSPGGFELETATGETLTARFVVVAVGFRDFAHMPVRLAHLPPELVSHTSRHRGFAAFAGRDITVIGGGQSALETAALAREQGADVRVLVRRPELVWNAPPQDRPRPLAQRVRYPMTGLGPGWRLLFYCRAPSWFRLLPETTRMHAVRTALGPAGAWWLRERVVGKVPVLTGHTVLSAEACGSGVRLRVQRDDGRVIDCTTEHLIAGTGYRVDLNRLTFLSERLREQLHLVDGAPVLSSSAEASVGNLHFLGLASAYSLGPSMRFVYGAQYSARRLADHLLASGSRRHGMARVLQ
jgi:thioredoxin reductase